MMRSYGIIRLLSSRRPIRVAALGLVLALASTASANNAKISADLQPLLANPTNNVNVIVQYRTPPQQSLGGALSGVVNLLGGVINTVFSLIPAVSATMHPADILAVSNQSSVTYISLDRSLGATLDYSSAGVNAPVAWTSGWDGTGVGIAVIDSGIYSHPDLLSARSGQSRVVYRKSFIGGVQNDDYGHGTHVAGIVAGTGALSNVPGSSHVLRGIAPNANLLDLRVLDENGSSNDSVVITALQTAVALKNRYNVRVINLSLGRPFYESCTLDPLCEAVEAAWNNGIVVVVAAGNLGRNGYSTVLSPGNSPHAITVGAMKTEETYTRNDDMIASYSSKGPTYIDLTVKPDVVAPGNLVVSLLAPGSTLANAYPQNVVGPSYYSSSTGPAKYFRLSGTSMATPVVSGAVALILQKDPTLTPDTIKARLMKTAGKTFPVSSIATDPTTGLTYTSFYDAFTVGAGYLDIAAALTSYEEAYLSSASPSSSYNPGAQQGYFVLPLTSNWRWWPQWSTTAVWGATVLPNNGTTIWNASYVWGSSGNWGTSIAWGTTGPSGTSIAWGTGGPSGSSIAWGTGGQGEP